MPKDKEYEENKAFLEQRVQIHLQPLMLDILRAKPSNVLDYIISWCQTRKIKGAKENTLNGSKAVPKKSFKLSKEDSHPKFEANNMPKITVQNSKEINSEAQNEEDRLFEEKIKQKILVKKKKRGISAEAYGQFNKMEAFKPKSYPKSQNEKNQLCQSLQKNFLFSSLEVPEQTIVIDSMKRKSFKANEQVIGQGEDGDELFIVFSGKLECSKLFPGQTKPSFIRHYVPGELFGELALMYNIPRAASIRTLEDSVLYSLDRLTFNHIVKNSMIKRRELYETFLNKIEIFNGLSAEEKGKLCDCVVEETFRKGDFIVRQGEKGDKLYLIKEGDAVALITDEKGAQKQVFEFHKYDYFGELALMSDEKRRASVKVMSDKMVIASIDRITFKRLLGPLENLLKKNAAKYEKYKRISFKGD